MGRAVNRKRTTLKRWSTMTGYKSPEQRRDSDALLPLLTLPSDRPTIGSIMVTIEPFHCDRITLHFAVLFAADLFDEQKLVFLAQALEGYHRCKFRHDIKFLRRLTELTNPNRDAFSGFIPDLPLFLETVRDARDELTHPGLGKADLARLDIYAMWRQLKATFEICVLNHFRVPSAALVRIAQECSDWIRTGCDPAMSDDALVNGSQSRACSQINMSRRVSVCRPRGCDGGAFRAEHGDAEGPRFHGRSCGRRLRRIPEAGQVSF